MAYLAHLHAAVGRVDQVGCSGGLDSYGGGRGHLLSEQQAGCVEVRPQFVLHLAVLHRRRRFPNLSLGQRGQWLGGDAPLDEALRTSNARYEAGATEGDHKQSRLEKKPDELEKNLMKVEELR